MDFLVNYFNYENDTINGLTNELSAFYVLEYFKKINKTVLVVTNSIFEANKIFNDISNLTDNALLYPMDDFITSVALAISPEFKFTRLETLNKINSKDPYIVVTNLTGYLKKISCSNKKRNMVLKKGDNLNKSDLISTLLDFGFNKESLVTQSFEFASRGMIVDLFPITSDYPIRIEYNGNIVESIKEFNPESQISNKELESIMITSCKESDDGNYELFPKFINAEATFIVNYDQLKISNEKLQEDIVSYKEHDSNFENTYYSLEELIIGKTYFVDTIRSNEDYNIRQMANYNENYEILKENYNKWINENKKVIFCLTTDYQKNIIREMFCNAKILNINLSKGFVIDKYVVISANDIGKQVNIRNNYKSKIKIGKRITSFNDINKGDYVVHLEHGIGIYNGLKTLSKNGIYKDYIQILYDKNDKIYIPIEKINTIYKYGDKDGAKPKLNRLNSISWLKTRAKAKSKAKDISLELLELYRERASIKKEKYVNYELEDIFNSEFEYELTKDQKKAVMEIENDLNSETPMDRLLCGDVGFGKTEVAARAINKAVLNNKQVIYLCPTTILSKQQYEVIKDRFKNIPVTIELLNRFQTPKQVERIKKELKDGVIDIVVGTHKLLANDIKFKNLGLLVVDEEQRFGVSHKEKIKNYKKDINVLTLSATPIPRTLKMALSGLRDLSIIETPPINRYPVQTYVLKENDLIIRDAIYKELSRKGQIYVLYNRIEDIYNIQDKLLKMVPEARIRIAYGTMNKEELDEVMNDFKEYKFDILLCTTIIENGIDIGNANTLIVYNADNFGLGQLYQIRGRVGRSDRIGHAYLFYKPNKELNDNAIKRLQAIKDFTELGSGYKIAMRDLAIRGAGDIFGSDQAGFVDEVGISLYVKMIENELKKAKGEIVIEDDDDNDDVSELNISTHIKDDYVSDEDIKIEIHKLINSISNKEELTSIKNEIVNRFGKIDDDMDIYMNNEILNYKKKQLDIYKIDVNDRFVEVILSKELSQKIKGDRFLIETLKLSNKFNISYMNNMINVKLYYKTLEKHYIYYLVDLMEIIE